MNGLTIPDSAPQFSLGIPKVTISLKKQRVIYFKMQDMLKKEDGDQFEVKIISDPKQEPYM
jgi:hypothetical protein